jgi:hypothetical protein
LGRPIPQKSFIREINPHTALQPKVQAHKTHGQKERQQNLAFDYWSIHRKWHARAPLSPSLRAAL